MENYFSDYDAYSENEIKEVFPDRIELFEGKTIVFADCVKNFAQYNDAKAVSCVGERDVADYSFTFYCSPHPIMIKFLKKPWIMEFFSKKPINQRFFDLQKKLSKCGYTTYDLS